jgi:hypothetical protein
MRQSPRTGFDSASWRIDRRAALVVLGGGAAALAVPARAAVDETTARISVVRSGARIGEGLVAYRREGDVLRVRVALEAKIDFGFITVFRYRHESEELWRDGRLVELNGRTDDDGKHYEMTARATEGGLAVEGSKGSFTAPADVLPLSYWHPDTIHRRQFVDAAKGRLLSVSIAPGPTQTIETATRRVATWSYDMQGDIAMTLWYDAARAWVGTRLKKKGEDINLVLDEPPLLTASLMAPAITQKWAVLGKTASAASYPAVHPAD